MPSGIHVLLLLVLCCALSPRDGGKGNESFCRAEEDIPNYDTLSVDNIASCMWKHRTPAEHHRHEHRCDVRKQSSAPVATFGSQHVVE